MKFPRRTIPIGQCHWPIPIWSNGQSRRLIPLESDLKDYGRIKIDGLRWQSHRLSYHLNVAKISRKPNKRKTNWILHHCDNKWCVNPEHLYLGSPKDNAIDNAKRNHEWRHNRSIAQKKLGGFPPISSAKRKATGRKNAVTLKAYWGLIEAEKAEIFARYPDDRSARMKAVWTAINAVRS